MTDLAVENPTTHQGAQRLLKLFWPILGGILLLRIGLAVCFNLVPDEAFYWLWTRHVAGGYLDHPPMIAWILWLSTRLLGDTQLGVRLPSLLLSLAAAAIVIAL